MGKKQASNFTLDSLGIGSSKIAADPVAQSTLQKVQAVHQNDMSQPDATNLVLGTVTPGSAEESNRFLPMGEDMANGVEGVEHQMGDAQPFIWGNPSSSAVGRALLKFAPLTAVKLGEGVMDLAGGMGYLAGFVTGSDRMTQAGRNLLNPDNAINQYLTEISAEMETAGIVKPIHSSTKADSDGVNPYLTSKFWTEDMLAQGGSNLLALVMGSKGLSAGVGGVTEGAAMLAGKTSLAELYQAVPIAQRIAAATAKNFNTTTVGFLNAATVSGMQAKDTETQIIAKLKEKYGSEINPVTGQQFTPEEVDARIQQNRGLIDEKTDNTFWATMVSQLLPSIYESKLILGSGATGVGQMNKAIINAVNSGKLTLADIEAGVGYEALKKTGWGSVGKEFVKAAVIEGPISENLELAIQNYDIDQATAGEHGNAWDSKFGYVSEFLDNFTNKEGVKNMVMGSIIGSLMGARHAYSELGHYNEALKGHLGSLGAADNLYGPAQKEIYKTNPSTGQLLLSEDGEPQMDVDKVAKLTFQMLHTNNLFNNQTAAMLTGNQDMATLNDNVALSQSIARELSSGRYESTNEAKTFFKWFHGQRIREQAHKVLQEERKNAIAESAEEQSTDAISGEAASVKTRNAMSTGSAAGDAALSKAVNDNAMLVDKMFSLYDAANRQSAKLTKLGESPDRTAFNDNVRKSLYYEAVKRESLMKLIQEKEELMKDPAANINEINGQATIYNKLHQDSLDRSQDLLSKTDEIYEAWSKFNNKRESLLNDAMRSHRESADNKDVESRDKVQRAANTAEYRLQEFNEKEGVANGKVYDKSNNVTFNGAPGMGGVGIDPATNDLAVSRSGEGTNQFIINQSIPERIATPLGSRNEMQFKAGQDFRKMAKLNSLIDRYRSGEENVSLKDIIGYANDNISHIDNETRQKLQSLVDEAKTKISKQEEALATMSEIDEEGQFNPDYAELNKAINNDKAGMESAANVLTRNTEMTELDRINRQPDKLDQHLNQQFAEKQLAPGNNVVASAIDTDGSIKDSYVDEGAVNRAIQKATNMRNALEDRMADGDLKGNKSYQYLVEKANELLAQLAVIQDAVVTNKTNREGMQQAINEREAHSNMTAIGFDLRNSSVTNQALFDMADQLLDGKLQDMINQIRELPSANFYEGTMAILHTLKTKASVENINDLVAGIDGSIETIVSTLPQLTINKGLLEHFSEAPEAYFSSMMAALAERGFEPADTKNGILNQFRRTNDIDQLETRVANMDPASQELGTTKDKALLLIKAYRDIVSANRVKNLLNSKIDLNETVRKEIEAAKSSGGIVPTTQQEVAIRDGLAWLNERGSVDVKKYGGWAFLRGIAGTGKTNVVVKWMMQLSGLNPDEIVTTALTEKAADVIARSTGTTSNTVEAVLNNPSILNGKKVLILDEYARLSHSEIEVLEKTIREHNKTVEPADRVKTLILGDPTQITSATQVFANQDITNPVANPSARRIRTLNPLTVVYRSDISAVNETSDIFQDNPQFVDAVNVRANGDSSMPHAVGTHTGKSGQDILDIVKTNQDYEKAYGISPRSRAIVVDTPDKISKYAETGIPVMTVYDAQSETYQEVYVDMDPTNFRGEEKFNTAMYTAASRAKEYSYIKYDKGTNNIDTGLTREKSNNDEQLRTAEGDYVKARAEESAMMEAGVQGKTVNIPKAEIDTKVVQAESPLQKATDPTVDEEAEIVNETPTSPDEQNLPVDPDPEGYLDPETNQVTFVTPIHYDTVLPGEHVLPNIESDAFAALKPNEDGTRQIDAGAPVTYLYTQEPNGENAITVFGHDAEGKWVPLSKIFQGELDKAPADSIYASLANRVKGMKPAYTSDPQRLNGLAGAAPETVDSLRDHVVQQATVTRHQRLTYQFSEKPVEGTGVLQHIKDIFKKKFFHKSPTEQAKAEKIHYKIFRESDFNPKNGAKFGGFSPDPGIPYAIVGIDPNSNDYRGAQFIRLTANRLNQSAEHYTALKAYRDLAKQVEEVGISHGTKEFNILMRSLKESLEVVQSKEETGNVPKLSSKENFTQQDLAEEILRLTTLDKIKVPEALDNLTHVDNVEQFNTIFPKMQEMAKMLYGVKERQSSLTEAELKANHDPAYVFVPHADGKVNADNEPLGRGEIPGLGGNKTVYARHHAIEYGEGVAQQAFNQLAKANEYAGNVRIRVPDNKNLKRRGVSYTGKSLITDQGGNTQIAKSVAVLGRILGETKVERGELTDEQLKSEEVRRANEAEVREMAKTGVSDANGIAQILLQDSPLSSERQTQLWNQLDKAINAKETPPITMATLDLMVGNENFQDGQHLTQEAYNVQNPTTKKTKVTQTYLRQPLDIDHFNELGKAPEKNADQLAGMVGTKLQDILPTQIAVANAAAPIVSNEPAEKAVTAERYVPGAKQELQDRITELSQKVDTLSGKDKRDAIRERDKLVKQRDGMAFDQQQRPDAGIKITTAEAEVQVKAMLPNIQPDELQFLNKAMMLEIQKPGENLLGLFQNGKILLNEDDGSVHSNVVRHEVFHAVFNDYLTQRERNTIGRAFDPEGKLAPEDLEEALADQFMVWQAKPETFSTKVKKIFNKIMNWIGFSRANAGQIDDLFKQIEAGKFQIKTNEISNSRMAFSDIRKYGTVQDYKNASKFIQKLIYDNFVDTNIKTMPVTAEETFRAVQEELRNQFAETTQFLDENINMANEVHAEIQLETDPVKLVDLVEELDGFNTVTIEYNQKLKMLDTFNNDRSALTDMWSDIYPSFKFNKSGTVNFTEDSAHEDPESLEKDEASQDKDGKGLTDFVIQSDERNQETKVTDSVKNFLSFVFRPQTKGEKTRVNPRGVYLQTLRALSGLSSSDGDFLAQVSKRALDNGIDINGKTDAALVIQHIISLYHNATDNAYTFNTGITNDRGQNITKRIELQPHMRFLDDNTFIMHSDGKSVQGLTLSSLPAEVIRLDRGKRNTAQFLEEVAATTGMDEAKGYFRQYQAQETLREVMSNFLSQREGTPMIAEEKRGFSTVLTYFRAQNHGIERVKTNEIEENFKNNWGKLTEADWKEFDTAKGDKLGTAVADILKKIGVKGTSTMSRVSNSNTTQAHLDLKAFREVVKQTEEKIKKGSVVNENASDSDEATAPANPVAMALENNAGMLDRLTKLMTQHSSDNRASSYTDTSGTKRYLFHNGSQAHDTLSKIVNYFSQNDSSKRTGSLPEHLTNDPILSKNIFGENGINKIYEVLDHDGQRQEGKEEFGTTYSNESSMQWLKRNFSDAFLSFAKTNASNNADPLTYMQNFYTISNRPRMTGARVRILSEPQLHEALVKGIEQHVEQPDIQGIKNYDRFKAVNFDEMHRAIEAIHPKELEGKTIAEHLKTAEGRAKIGRIYNEIAGSTELKAAVASNMMEQLKSLSDEAMQKMKAENVPLDSDVTSIMKLLKDPRKAVIGAQDPIVESEISTRKNGWPEDDLMRSTVESFYKNNYVNSYFLNQVVAGNMNFFKDGLDMIKRMSGIFAPGTKGMIGDKFFMKQKFKVAISADPKLKADMLSPIFEDTRLKSTLKRSGIDLADAQGYMLPERAENLVQGFGKNYNSGAVFKPAHYEVSEREVDGQKLYVPTMLKYSSVVLSDELVQRFPKLEALRTEMRNNDIAEYVFDSADKVGAPLEQVQSPSVIAYENNKFTIDPKSVIELSNENYRLQLNPNHEAYDTVSNPTQLGYFLNVMHKLSGDGKFNSRADAIRVYDAIGEKISRGINKLGAKSTDAKGRFTVSAIRDKLSGKGDERLQEMLASGIDYNFPNIADKAVIQMANIVSGQTVQIKFPGGKMVLQSSYGIDIPNKAAGHEEFWSAYGNEERQKIEGQARRLEYKQDPDTGRWFAEVILPMAYKTKAGIGDYVLPDGMGFRIPSTELHSSIPFKVAGFYDSKGSNVVIAPAELVAQHGSDFDVDSLYVITREMSRFDIDQADGRKLITKGMPVGYYATSDGGKYEFNGDRFRAELERAKLDYAEDKKVLGQLEKLHDQMLNNQITDSFINTISHPDMKDRMLTPISTEVLDEAFKKLGINGDKSVNTSRLLDNLRMYNSNFQGASLVGIFANGAKALSYMSRAGARTDGDVTDAYPQVNEKLHVTIGDKVYSNFTELDATDGNLWEELDALINTSVDNVKEQKLSLMNATDRTGPVYIAAKAIGMPLVDTMRLMLQPVIKQYSNIEGSRGTVMTNLRNALKTRAAELDIISEGQSYDDLKTALESYGDHTILTDKSMNVRLNEDTLGNTPDDIAHQVQVLEQFSKLAKMGEDITTFSRAISIVQDMPVFYYDIANKQQQWDSMGTVVDGVFKTDPDFGFNLDNLFQNQPNIAEAYKAFTWLKDSVDKSVIKHFPEMQTLAKSLAKSMRIRLSFDENKNVEAIKNEAMSYLVSSYYANDLKMQAPITIERTKGNNIVLTGRSAWSHEFAGELADVVEEDTKANTEENRNPFLKRISVTTDSYGIRNVQFANASNPTAEESLEMQEGFSTLADEDIKQGLVKYAALNYGMSFGIRNYSMFIPSEYIKPISDFISSDIRDKVQASTIDLEGNVVDGPLRNMSDNLAMKMAVNNVDRLPFIKRSGENGIAPIQTKDAAGKARFTEDGIPILQGFNGDYFWHRAYENPIVKEGGDRKYNDDKLPPMIWQRDGNGRDVAYFRVNDVDSPEVYYQRAGYRNYRGGYEASLEAINGLYKPEDYFGKGTIPVPVADVYAKEYQTRSEYIKEGSRVVVYPYSNETRELGRVGIVDKVRSSLGDPEKITFTLKPELTSTPEEFSRETQHIADIAKTVAERFGLTVRHVESLPNGAKGSYVDGVVTLTKNASVDTPFHEVSHPLVAAIKQQNPIWYGKLATELKSSPEGRAILSKVQAKYPELSKDGQEVEALVTAIGQEAGNRIPESNFKQLVRRLMRSVGNLMKKVINELKLTGGISLDTLRDEDMSKLTISDIADIMAAKEFKGLDLSKVKDEIQYSKDLDEDKPWQGTMRAILEKSEAIEEPEVDSNGQQGDFYTRAGIQLQRVSKLLDNFTFRTKEEMIGPDGKPMSTIDAIAKRDADRMFKNVQPGGKLIIDGIELSKEDYQEQKRKIQLQAQVKGDIIHAKIQQFFATDPAKQAQLQKKIEELSSKTDVRSNAYDWITKKAVFSKLMENAGIEIGSRYPDGTPRPKELQDKIYSEVKIGSDLLGAGMIDMLVEKADGRLKINDWKTGSRLRDKYSANILRYGVQENRITDNPLDRAKLQVMTYALIIKAEHPEAKFDGLTIMHIPNEYEATQPRNALSVEVPDYLRMIEQYYRNEQPKVYKELLAKSPNIFDPREYNAPRNADFVQDVLNGNGASEAETLQQLRLNLQKLIVSVEMRKAADSGDEWTRDERKLRDNMMKKILEAGSYIPVDFTGDLDSKFEISIMTRYLGNLNDTHNPYVQSYAQVLNTGRRAAEKELDIKKLEFRKLEARVLKEKGLTQNLVQKAVQWNDKAKIYGNLWEQTETVDPESGTKFMRRGLVTEKSPKWNSLSVNEQALSTYMRKEMRDIFEQIMTKGPEAVVGKDEKGNNLTKLDLYNKSARGANFKYEDDFVPRIPITAEEVKVKALQQGLSGIGTYAKDFFLRRATDYFENNVEGYNQKDYGIPVRFLGNGNTYVSPETYSMDLELAFNKYMEQMINKKHLDSAWVAGTALKGYLETKNDINGNPAFKNTVAFLDYHMDNIMIGDRIKRSKGLTRNGVSIGQKDGEQLYLSTSQIYRTMKSGVAAATLWVQPVSAAKNALQAGYMVLKESAVNSIGKNYAGISPLETDLSMKVSYGEAMKSQWATFTGNANSDFTHTLAKELRLYPEMSEAMGKHEELMTKGATLLNTKTFGYLYQMPEEVTAVMYALNSLKSMQINSGPYKGKTMYDMYKESFVVNEAGDGSFQLPADFKRGKIQLPDGTFEDLAGLHPLEMQKISRGVQKLRGGYKPDEKTAIQGTILGDAMMMFKRWIPAMATAQYKSKYMDPSTGQFELSKIGNEIERRNGEDVYTWRARVVEGRSVTLAKFFIAMTKYGKQTGYNWADLSGEQKKGLIDAGISLATWVSMLGFGIAAFGDKDEKNSMKQFTSEMTGRFMEQWYTPALISNAAQPPAVVKKTNDMITGFQNLITAGYYSATDGPDEKIHTNKGDLKGVNAIMKNTPFVSSYYNVDKFLDENK